MPKTFKGPRQALSRSRYGQKARDVKSGKLAKLRAKEKAGEGQPSAFDAAVEVAKARKPKRGG